MRCLHGTHRGPFSKAETQTQVLRSDSLTSNFGIVFALCISLYMPSRAYKRAGAYSPPFFPSYLSFLLSFPTCPLYHNASWEVSPAGSWDEDEHPAKRSRKGSFPGLGSISVARSPRMREVGAGQATWGGAGGPKRHAWDDGVLVLAAAVTRG